MRNDLLHDGGAWYFDNTPKRKPKSKMTRKKIPTKLQNKPQNN
jgi:hypothetical protein